MPRLLVSEVVRAAALADLEVDRLLDVTDAVHEGVPRRLRFPQRLDILAQELDVAPPVGAQLPLEAPASEGEEAGLRTLELLRRVEAILQVALEHVGPEVVAFNRQTLELEAAAGAEVVVRHEIARQLRRLLLLRPRQRFRVDDV